MRRKPNAKGIKIATELYAKIKEAEKNGGIESGLALFHKHFQELGESYEDFILHTQVEQ